MKKSYNELINEIMKGFSDLKETIGTANNSSEAKELPILKFGLIVGTCLEIGQLKEYLNSIYDPKEFGNDSIDDMINNVHNSKYIPEFKVNEMARHAEYDGDPLDINNLPNDLDTKHDRISKNNNNDNYHIDINSKVRSFGITPAEALYKIKVLLDHYIKIDSDDDLHIYNASEFRKVIARTLYDINKGILNIDDIYPIVDNLKNNYSNIPKAIYLIHELEDVLKLVLKPKQPKTGKLNNSDFEGTIVSKPEPKLNSTMEKIKSILNKYVGLRCIGDLSIYNIGYFHMFIRGVLGSINNGLIYENNMKDVISEIQSEYSNIPVALNLINEINTVLNIELDDFHKNCLEIIDKAIYNIVQSTDNLPANKIALVNYLETFRNNIENNISISEVKEIISMINDPFMIPELNTIYLEINNLITNENNKANELFKLEIDKIIKLYPNYTVDLSWNNTLPNSCVSYDYIKNNKQKLILDFKNKLEEIHNKVLVMNFQSLFVEINMLFGTFGYINECVTIYKKFYKIFDGKDILKNDKD